MRCVSYIVAFTGDDGLEHIGCIHNFIHIGKKKEDYLVAAVSLLKGPDGKAICTHPKYHVSMLCMWPPPPFPTLLIRSEQLKHICLVVRIEEESHAGRDIAHVMKYIHKSLPDPRWWVQQEPGIM